MWLEYDLQKNMFFFFFLPRLSQINWAPWDAGDQSVEHLNANFLTSRHQKYYLVSNYLVNNVERWCLNVKLCTHQKQI